MNATKQRVYTTVINRKKRFVRAPARADAILHVADRMIEATVTTHDELIEAVRAGTEIENARGDAEAQLPIEA